MNKFACGHNKLAIGTRTLIIARILRCYYMLLDLTIYHNNKSISTKDLLGAYLTKHMI